MKLWKCLGIVSKLYRGNICCCFLIIMVLICFCRLLDFGVQFCVVCAVPEGRNFMSLAFRNKNRLKSLSWCHKINISVAKIGACLPACVRYRYWCFGLPRRCSVHCFLHFFCYEFRSSVLLLSLSCLKIVVNMRWWYFTTDIIDRTV